MPVRFEKADEAPFGKFDGFDPKTVYQMVPLGDTRGGLSLISDAEEIEATFDPPGIAHFSDRSFVPPSPLPASDQAIRLAPQSTLRFKLFGERTGNATLVVRNRQGRPLAGLLVSVKALVTKTYALCRVSDMRRTCPWPEPQLRPMMEAVRKTFLQQANIKLQEKTPQIFDVNINDRDLGDPLIPERVVRPEQLQLNFIILRRCPAAAILVDLTILFVWDLRSNRKPKEIVGINLGQACYVEYNSVISTENGLTTAHEIGHALGLGHAGADSLMAGDGNSRTSLLAQFEIDTINRTDEQGPL